jgi:hypothetical protein
MEWSFIKTEQKEEDQGASLKHTGVGHHEKRLEIRSK